MAQQRRTPFHQQDFRPGQVQNRSTAHSGELHGRPTLYNGQTPTSPSLLFSHFSAPNLTRLVANAQNSTPQHQHQRDLGQRALGHATEKERWMSSESSNGGPNGLSSGGKQNKYMRRATSSAGLVFHTSASSIDLAGIQPGTQLSQTCPGQIVAQQQQKQALIHPQCAEQHPYSHYSKPPRSLQGRLHGSRSASTLSMDLHVEQQQSYSSWTREQHSLQVYKGPDYKGSDLQHHGASTTAASSSLHAITQPCEHITQKQQDARNVESIIDHLHHYNQGRLPYMQDADLQQKEFIESRQMYSSSTINSTGLQQHCLDKHSYCPLSTHQPDSLSPPSSRRSSGGLSIDSRLFTTDSMRSQFFDSFPNVLLTGLAGSGKTSISEVVYRKSSPHETLFIPQTQSLQIYSVANTDLVQFNIVDCPCSIFQDTAFDCILFPNAKSVIFVIDAQNEHYVAEIRQCKDLFKRVWKWNPRINFEVFIHKVDGDFFSVDEVRAECQRDIHDKLMSYLHEAGVIADVVFYSTTIYDQTILEACSRVIQRLTPQIGTLERLLDILVAKCKMEKAFLIDVLSKTFIATDSSPFDPFHYELCTDMVDLVIEISSIYGHAPSRNQTKDTSEDNHQESNTNTTTDNLPSSTSGINDFSCGDGSIEGSETLSINQSDNKYEDSVQNCSEASPLNNQSRRQSVNPKNRVSDGVDSNTTNSINPINPMGGHYSSSDNTEGSTLCLIQLNNGYILYLREVDRLLALACVIKEEHFDRQYLVDHNIRVFRDAMLEFFQRR